MTATSKDVPTAPDLVVTMTEITALSKDISRGRGRLKLGPDYGG